MAFGEEAGTEAGSSGDDFDDFESSDGGDFGVDDGGGGGGGNAGGNDSGGAGGDDDDDDGGLDDFKPSTSPSGTGEGSETLSSNDSGGGIVADDIQPNRTDSAEAAGDLAGAGTVGATSRREGAAEAASDLGAVGLLASQARGRRRGRRRRREGAAERAEDAVGRVNAGDQRDRAEFAQDRRARLGSNAELVGGSGRVEDTIRDLDRGAGAVAERLGDAFAGLTAPRINPDAVSDVIGDIKAGEAPRAETPAFSARPQEARDNTPGNVAESAGAAAGDVLFRTPTRVALGAIEAGEGVAAVGRGAARDFQEGATGQDIQLDETDAAAERVSTAGNIFVQRNVVDPAERTFEVRPDAVRDVVEDVQAGEPARAEEPAFEVEPGRRDEFSGGLIGSAAAAGVAAPVTAAASPVQVTRLDLPDADGGTTRVTAVRTRGPVIGGRTLAGRSTGLPERGAPSIDPDGIDFTKLGGRDDRAVEPVGELETGVFRSTARKEGGQPEARSEAQERVLTEAESLEADPDRIQAGSAEDLVGEARRVPEGAESDVADALRDLDATVFGSAATRAQVSNFREPNDLDIAVEDEAVAKERLSQALAGQEASVEDVFDIKETSEAPGKAQGGEPIKFGRTSDEPIEFDGLQVNPVSEETVRKVGAAGFFRGPGAPEGADNPLALPGQFDVGPQPRRAGRVDVRRKDVDDAITLARGLEGVSDEAASRFERAFTTPAEDVGRRSAGGLFDTERDAVRQFVQEERAQGDIGGGRRRFDEQQPNDDFLTRRDDEPAPRDDDSPSPRDRRDRERDSPVPSSPAAAGGGFASPLPGLAPSVSPVEPATLPESSPFGSPPPSPDGVGSPGAPSPGGPGSPPGTSPPGGSPPGGSPPGTSPPGSPGVPSTPPPDKSTIITIPPVPPGRPPTTARRTPDDSGDQDTDEDQEDAGFIESQFLSAVGDPVNLAFGFEDPTDRDPARTPVGEGFSELEAAAEQQAPDAAIEAISEDVRGDAEAFGIQDGTEFRFEVGRR